jgi:integrase
VRGHVAKKGKNYYAVIYSGIDPRSGKERYRWVAAGPRRGDAERLVNDLVKRRHDGDDGPADRTTLQAYLVDRWLPIQETRLRPSTYSSYKSTIDLHVVPYIGGIRLDRLHADDLDRLYVDLLRNGNRRGKTPGGLSATSVRYVHRVLSKALNDARRKGAISRNVATLADPPRAESAGARAAIQVWDAVELRQFLDLTADHPLHVLWVVAAKTGMRRGELVGLRWQDVDLAASTISVRQAAVLVGTTVHVSDAKTNSGRRTIDLDANTVDVLRAHRTAHRAAATKAPSSRADRVFIRDDAGALHPERVTRTFAQLVAEHELPHIRFHDLRHTHATLLLKAGVPAKVVAERLGHATPGFTLNVYQHVLPGMQAAAATVFDDLLRQN